MFRFSFINKDNENKNNYNWDKIVNNEIIITACFLIWVKIA